MKKDNDFVKQSASIIEEIENQLKAVLSQKKEKVEKELEEKIRLEKDEAEKKITQIEEDIEEEKESLTSYKSILSEFESEKEDIKRQIKEHLDRAIQFQTEIEVITGKSLEELRNVSELNKKLEEINQEVTGKVTSLKVQLEEKYGIVADIPENDGGKEVSFNLKNELSKLNKIKELLTAAEPLEEEIKEVEHEEEPEVKPEVGPDFEAEGEEPEQGLEQETEVEAVTETEETIETKMEEEKEGKRYLPGEPRPDEDTGEEDISHETEEEFKPEETFQDTYEVLEKYRKVENIENDGEINYFENNNKMILDTEVLISVITDSIDKAKKLYIELSETESPKDQFFIKQEIIRNQDELRKFMLGNIRMCEKDNCSLPRYTVGILNENVLKDILEKVSMENWSNEDDFISFENEIKELKDNYYECITPPAKYLESIIEELEIK